MTLPGATLASDDAGINAVSVCRKLPATGPADHHGEFDLAMVLAGRAGGPHARHHGLRSGAMPDQVEFVTGEQALRISISSNAARTASMSSTVARRSSASSIGRVTIGNDRSWNAPHRRRLDADKANQPEQHCIGHASSFCPAVPYRTQLLRWVYPNPTPILWI